MYYVDLLVLDFLLDLVCLEFLVDLLDLVDQVVLKSQFYCLCYLFYHPCHEFNIYKILLNLQRILQTDLFYTHIFYRPLGIGYKNYLHNIVIYS